MAPPYDDSSLASLIHEGGREGGGGGWGWDTGREEGPNVRRLTTVSSVTKPPHYTLTTEWVWYYRDNHRSWVEYGQPDSGQRTTSVTSRDLEQAYQKNPLNKVLIMKGFRKYLLSFKDMYQWNQALDTRRRVRRRPRFLSAAGLATLTAR
ncbi:unnamed protein product [Arctogadus glacialis]